MLLVSNLGFIGSPACYRAILEMVEVLCEVEYHQSRCGAPSSTRTIPNATILEICGVLKANFSPISSGLTPPRKAYTDNVCVFSGLDIRV